MASKRFVPVTLTPTLFNVTGAVYFVAALIMGLAFLGFSVMAALTRTRAENHPFPIWRKDPMIALAVNRDRAEGTACDVDAPHLKWTEGIDSHTPAVGR